MYNLNFSKMKTYDEYYELKKSITSMDDEKLVELLHNLKEEWKKDEADEKKDSEELQKYLENLMLVLGVKCEAVVSRTRISFSFRYKDLEGSRDYSREFGLWLKYGYGRDDWNKLEGVSLSAASLSLETKDAASELIAMKNYADAVSVCIEFVKNPDLPAIQKAHELNCKYGFNAISSCVDSIEKEIKQRSDDIKAGAVLSELKPGQYYGKIVDGKLVEVPCARQESGRYTRNRTLLIKVDRITDKYIYVQDFDLYIGEDSKQNGTKYATRNVRQFIKSEGVAFFVRNNLEDVSSMEFDIVPVEGSDWKKEWVVKA